MPITANVIPSEDNSIELAMQAFQIGGALTQAAAERAWKVSNEAAADKGMTLAEFAASPEGGDFMRRRFGGILAAIPRKPDPVTGVPRTWAIGADKLVAQLATPATMSLDKKKSWVQGMESAGKVVMGDDGRYKPAEGLSTQESYFAQQAAELLNRFQASEETIAQETPALAPQGQAVSYKGEAQPKAEAQTVTPAQAQAAPQGTLEQPNVLEWAAKTLIKPSKPAQYGGEDAGTRGKDTFESFDVYDAKGNIIARNQTMDSAKMLLQRRLDATMNQTPTKADYDAQREVMDTASANLKAAGYTQDKSLLWQPPSVASRPEAARMAQWSDAQLYGMLASPGVSKPQRQLIQELLDERRKTGQRPQISPESPTAQAAAQPAAQGAQGAPQAAEKSPPTASPGGQGSIETAQAGKPAQTLRQWLIAHPELSNNADFNRDPNAPDTPEFVAAIRQTMGNTWNRYNEEMRGNAQTKENGVIGENASYGQARRASEKISAEAMSEIRRAVPGHRRQLNNVLLAGGYIPWDAQKYLTGEAARKSAEAMPDVEKARAQADLFKAQVDLMKEKSANARNMLDNFRQRLSPWDDQMAQVAKLAATEPKKAKEALDRIIVDMNQNPQVRGLVDGFNTTASWLSDGNLLSVPTIFTAEQKKLFYAWSAASIGTSLQPRAMAGAPAEPQASVPGANQKAADAYEAGLRQQ